jgi:mono/diheme cytochrome c family protein
MNHASMRSTAIVVLGLAAGAVVTTKTTKATPAATPSAASPTFNKDIAPILYANCATCHRPGEIAPFSLLSYQDAARHAKTIAKVTARHVMPPWKAEPGYGDFANERRLTDGDIARIGEWVRAGAPEGDARDKPAVPSFPEGWQGGKPDRVLTLGSTYTVPADGPDQYRCFVMPMNLDHEVYLGRTEFRPGNRRVVHHAILFLDTTGTGRRLDAATPEPGYSCFGGPGFLPTGMIGGWAPGAMPPPRIEGVAKTIPKGTDVIVQVHYHPSGKPEQDASTLGLTFSDPPTRGQSAIIIRSRQIDIPPGESHYLVKASITVPQDVELAGITPHAHYLCKDMKINADLPDGTHVPLIWIKDWDFDWQGQYAYKTPIHLPKGTQVSFEYTYDNSAANPRNPSDPPVRVTWGEQTKNEMALAFLRVLLPSPASVPSFEQAMRMQYLKSFLSQGSGATGALLRTAPGGDMSRLKTLLAIFDSNADGVLDTSERTAMLEWLERVRSR